MTVAMKTWAVAATAIVGLLVSGAAGFKDDGGCYQVWLAGKNVELRRAGLPAASEGVLQPLAPRN